MRHLCQHRLTGLRNEHSRIYTVLFAFDEIPDFQQEPNDSQPSGRRKQRKKKDLETLARQQAADIIIGLLSHFMDRLEAPHPSTVLPFQESHCQKKDKWICTSEAIPSTLEALRPHGL